ncbi:MAG: MFS transporter, partial [Lacipirellulaceae bacterium]
MALSTKLIFSAVVAALGGFLFGFDTVVISGAEQKFQSLWDLHDSLHGWAMSSARWGTVVGALLGSVPADRFGRKATLIWVGLFFLVSAVWSGLATDVYCFMIARFVGGLGVGVSTVAAPLYIAEIAPAEKRGFLTGLFQFNIVFGILGAFLSNSLLEGTSEDDWRWMLGIEGFPAVIYTIAALFIPESPRWLIGIQSRRNDGQAVLAEIAPEASDEEITSMADAIEAASKAEVKATGGATFPKQLRVPILLAFL